MQTESFSMPQTKIGDMIYWYSDALSCSEPCIGWISQRPGVHTVTALVFSPNTGFIEKPSVRHRNDPGLQESVEWRQWGAWEYAPVTAQLRKVDSVMAQVASATEQLALARKQNGGTKNG
jgi:hypothetical protein